MRQPEVPRQLTRGPFTLAQAERYGVTRWQLMSSAWRRIIAGVYVWAGLPDTPLLTLQGVRLRLPAGSAFCGLTAAWLHGLDVEPCDPVAVLVPAESGMSCRDLWISRMELRPAEMVERRGLPATSIARTLCDLRRRLPLAEAVAAADQALHRGLLDLGQLHPKLARWCDPRAESVMESRLRILLVRSGLPRPLSQVDLHDEQGRFLARADLYYPTHRLVIEFDGGNHRERLVGDDRRQNLLQAANHQILRFTTPDVLGAPRVVVAQVRDILRRPPPKPPFPQIADRANRPAA